jgi:hypothetical protein
MDIWTTLCSAEKDRIATSPLIDISTFYPTMLYYATSRSPLFEKYLKQTPNPRLAYATEMMNGGIMTLQ